MGTTLRLPRITAALALGLVALVFAVPAASASPASPASPAASKNIVQVAAGNPQFSTLAGLIQKAGLVSALSGKSKLTVFAPTNAAFAKLPKATLKKVQGDKKLLTSILTYHVVPGQVLPADIEGTHTTVNGADLEVTGSGDNIMVNGQAAVICGGVQTANATVYLIDTVLMPPAA